MGYPPIRVDIMTSISGVSWEDAYMSREEAKYGDIPAYFIGLDQYVQNKKASGRKKDLADLKALGKE